MTHTILVTGAQGFVGRWFVAHALHRWPDHRIVGIGRSAQSTTFTHAVTLGAHRVRAPLPNDLSSDSDRFTYRTADVLDTEALVEVLRETRPTYVLHLASALRDEPPHALFPTNVDGTISLLTAIGRTEARPQAIVIGSSGSVYGTPASLPLRETSGCAPNDPYAISKLCAELAATPIAKQFGLPVIVARLFNIVGPGLDERHACARFASQFASIAAGLSDGRMTIGDLSPTRDFIDVRDVAAALAILLERGTPGTTYNVASGQETSIETIFKTLEAQANLPHRVEVDQGYSRSTDCRRACADISRLRALDFTAGWTIAESLRSLYAYYAGPVTELVGQIVARTPSTSDAAVVASATQG
jgi:nucleoside-diphosphate-sugar epimerase